MAKDQTDQAHYQVIARKWRPQSFQELIGQDHISTTLLNAIRGDRLPQALLFAGVRGTGKTSTARILAMSLRCQKVVDHVPCGECRDCEDIGSSRAIDVIEIDGASNNGVEAIRELRDSVGYMPSSGKYKIYIIDEVHMLSTAAFNALLKTLEEPPQHVIFILATTEAQKIPNTILSRCQRFDFRRIPSRQIAQHLIKISAAENVKADPDAIWAIARQADGSMRDGQSLLDQVITFSNKVISLDKVIEVLGLTDRALVIDGVASLIRRDPKAALALVEKINRSGVDPKLYAQDLLEEIRNTLMVRLCADDPTRVVDLPDSEIHELRQLASQTSEEDLHTLFDMMLKGVTDLLRSSDPRLVLEMTMLRVASSPTMISFREFLSGASTNVTPTSVSVPMVPLGTTLTSAAKLGADAFTRPAKPKVTANGMATALPPEPKSAPAPAAKTDERKVAEANPDDHDTDVPPPADSKDPWLMFVYQVRRANGLLGAMLENTHVLEQSAEKIVIGVPKKVSFMIDKIKDPENIRRVEQFIETIWSKRLKVEIKLADAASARNESLTPRAKEERARTEKEQSIEAEIEQNPLVRSAKNVFKTQLKSIRDADRKK